MDLNSLFSKRADDIVSALKEKTIVLPPWALLQTQYDPRKHPVMSRAVYPDIPSDDGTVEHVTRITYDLQRLAVKRMSELCNGIPVKRVYYPENDKQGEVAKYIENILMRNRINSVNVERCNMLFAGCEVMTLWYAVEERTNIYGFASPFKLRCRNFSPMLGDELYPLFDEYGDLVAMSVSYARKSGDKAVQYFDTYTKERHLKFVNDGGAWATVEDDNIAELGKIPAVYMHRPSPIWEDTSRLVYEMEWAMSRNGNYLRRNSKPVFCVFADGEVQFGREESENREFRSILQYPQGSSAGYITWEQAVDNLKFYISELRQAFFTQLQLPDWNYEKMSQQALSGESRKQLFIDAQMKVKDESGRLVEFYDREINVIKQFLRLALGSSYAEDIEALQFECVITPYSITDEHDTISNLVLANGGKPIMSMRESIERFGYSDNVDKTLEEIENQERTDLFEPTY